MRNSFLTPLIVEVMPSGKRFKLFFDFSYYWKRKGVTIRVKRGFETDFASIPQPFHWLISKLGRYNKPSVLHDAVYQLEFTLLNTPDDVFSLTRADADLLLLDAMADFGVVKWKRTLLYYGVRIGGWMAWRKSESLPSS